MKWQDIKQQAGGRNAGTNHHTLSLANFNKKARNRWLELNLGEYDEVFSLRLNNCTRLYGIRDGRVLRFVWHDPYHGGTNGAYPTKNK